MIDMTKQLTGRVQTNAHVGMHVYCTCYACVRHNATRRHACMLYNAPCICACVVPRPLWRSNFEVRVVRSGGHPLKLRRSRSQIVVRPTTLICDSATDCVDRRGAQVHLKLPRGCYTSSGIYWHRAWPTRHPQELLAGKSRRSLWPGTPSNKGEGAVHCGLGVQAW